MTSKVKKLLTGLGIFTVFLIVGLILITSIKGLPGNPTIKELNSQVWTNGGPFELSPERGRVALLYSIVEYHSFLFPLDVAMFALPDLGYTNGNYVSLFAPGVSFVVIPGYLLGKLFGISQVGTFAVVTLFAFLNCILIYKIAKQFNSNVWPALTGMLIYIFATPAFAYAGTIYQHHISTFLILLSVYLLFAHKNFLSLAAIWFMCTLSISIDYPNFFMMLPIGIAALATIVNAKMAAGKLALNIKTFLLPTMLFMLIPLGFFFWFNNNTYGNPLQLAGSATQVRGIDASGKPTDTNFTSGINDETTDVSETLEKTNDKVRNPVTYFKTRNILNGLYILVISPDRGILSFTPVILIGILGMIAMHKNKDNRITLLFSILMMNIILYAMWGDPWGGWAFGARYLIPSYAILAIFIAYLLAVNNNKILLLTTFGLFAFSAYVNTAGALSTNAIPPKVEVLALEKMSGKEEKYTVKRGLDLLNKNTTNSFVFNQYVKNHVSAMQFFYFVWGTIVIIALIIFINLIPKNARSHR